MLRSMSFIGSWKPQGSIPEEGHEFPRGSGLHAPGGKGDAGQGHGGGDGGGGSSRLDLNGFVVDPADLLAGDAVSGDPSGGSGDGDIVVLVVEAVAVVVVVAVTVLWFWWWRW